MSRHFVVRAVIAAFAIVCLMPAVALAQKDKQGQGKRPDPAKVFSKRDTDGDGKLSLEEFKAGMPEKALARADSRFKKLDSNGDGSLSLEEFETGIKARPKKPA